MSTFFSPQTFVARSQEDNTQSYADLMPLNKRLWAAMNISDSTVRTFLSALALELGRFQDLEHQIASEYIPNFDTSLIEQWEEMLGIPDDCFLNSGTDAERRRNIIIKLAFMNLQVPQDYFNLAALLDLEIQILFDQEFTQFTYTFPMQLNNTEEAKFIWIINISNVTIDDFPYTFPITFGVSAAELFECICLKQKPANTNLIFTFNPIEYTDGLENIYVDGNDNSYITG